MGIHYYTTPKPLPDGQRIVDRNDRVMTTDQVIIMRPREQKPVNIELQLPTAAEYKKFKIITLIGSSTLVPNGKDTINGTGSGEKYSVATNQNIELISDGVSNQKLIDLYTEDGK